MCFTMFSCSKGYRVRVSNYYMERLDSVIIGNRAVIFTNVEHGTDTGFEPITSGEHAVECLTASGERFWITAPLPKGGEGDRTIQIDGLKEAIVLEF